MDVDENKATRHERIGALLARVEEGLRAAEALVAEAPAAVPAGDGGGPDRARAPAAAPTVEVYWAGCRGCAALARDLGAGAHVGKIGVHVGTEMELSRRLALLGRDAYGGWHREASGALVKHDGFTAWIALAIGTTRAPSNPAITCKTRSIAVTLPDGMGSRAFDEALRLALSGHELSRRHAGVQRLTAYSVGETRISRARELYRLHPERDGDVLLAAVELVLARHRARRVAAGLPALTRPASRDEAVGHVPRAAPSPASGSAAGRVPARRRMNPAQLRAMRARLSRGKRGRTAR